MIGQTIAGYRVLDKIGAGGMGEVYIEKLRYRSVRTRSLL